MIDHFDEFAKAHKLRIAMNSLCPACGAGPGMKCRLYVVRKEGAYVEILDDPHTGRLARAPVPRA